MNQLMPFIVVGLTTGSVYGLAAMGLVLTYKTSGIFNFAHGTIAAAAAFCYYDLRTLHGLPVPVALLMALGVLPPILALVMERVTRALAGGTPTAKIVGTVGLQLAILSFLLLHYGGAAVDFPTFLPTGTVDLPGVSIGVDQLLAAGTAAGAALGFFVFFRVSAMGVQMRAVVDSPELLALSGTNPFVVRAWAWLIGTWFAALSGILLAPQIGLNAVVLTLLVVQAYGAAAVGRFESLPLTYAGGLIIGLLASLATKFVSGSQTLAGLPPAMPFLVLFLVLLLTPRGRLVEAGGHRVAPTSGGRLGTRAVRTLAVLAIAVGAAVPLFVGTRLPVYSAALVLMPVFYSLHLLVRTSGQISLAHASLVAIGSAVFSHLAVDAGLPWLLAVVLAGVVAALVGAVVAMPAIRLSGLFLALATFGFALLMERVMYPSALLFGPTNTRPAPRPAWFEGDTPYYYLLLIFVVACAALVTLVRRSRLGRLLRGLADAPTTLSTLGLGVNVTRVIVFALSAFIAGVAGGLYASLGQSATGVPFSSFVSLTWLALLVLNSGARSAAPIVAAIGLTVVPSYIGNDTVNAWMPVMFGLGALFVAGREATATGRHGRADRDETAAGSRAADRLRTRGPRAARGSEAVHRHHGESAGHPVLVKTAFAPTSTIPTRTP